MVQSIRCEMRPQRGRPRHALTGGRRAIDIARQLDAIPHWDHDIAFNPYVVGHTLTPALDIAPRHAALPPLCQPPHVMTTAARRRPRGRSAGRRAGHGYRRAVRHLGESHAHSLDAGWYGWSCRQRQAPGGQGDTRERDGVPFLAVCRASTLAETLRIASLWRREEHVGARPVG